MTLKMVRHLIPWILLIPRKKFIFIVILFVGIPFCIIISQAQVHYNIKAHFGQMYHKAKMSNQTTEPTYLYDYAAFKRAMTEQIALMDVEQKFVNAKFYSKYEDVIFLHDRLNECLNTSYQYGNSFTSTLASEEQNHLNAILKNMTNYITATGFNVKMHEFNLRPSSYQLMPHLLADPYSMKPQFYIGGMKTFVEFVIGITTVKRDKAGYLMLTLKNLFKGFDFSDPFCNSTMFVIFIGETDPEYILMTAKQIESQYPKEVAQGLIEIIAPTASYYPDFDSMKPTLGDSKKRMKWRTKQNLDNMFLMMYCQTKGLYYMMIEDDVLAVENYLTEIRTFTRHVNVNYPQWIILDFCRIGAIGKLFKSSDLLRFIIYVQLFYQSMPIDWLMDTYVDNVACIKLKESDECKMKRQSARPKFPTTLFHHIGIMSSLKGKVHIVPQNSFPANVPKFFPHSNPKLKEIKTNIEHYQNHTIESVYNGTGFFWGINPKNGDYIEFVFLEPTYLERYLFRTGNVDHLKDNLVNANVEILTEDAALTKGRPHLKINSFDELGMAEDKIDKNYGKLISIRIKLTKNSAYWIVISEIELTISNR